MNNIYETEGNPVDTSNFTFEQAVGGCYYAAEQVAKLNEKLDNIDEIMKMKKVDCISNVISQKKEKYDVSTILIFDKILDKDKKENKNFPISEKEKKIQLAKKRMTILVMLFFLIIALYCVSDEFIKDKNITSLTFPFFIFVIIGMFFVMLFIREPKEIRKERKTHPWHFNGFPIGSNLYLLQKDFNNTLEDIHRIYYDTYLPCKRKADELFYRQENRDGKLYEVYKEIVSIDQSMLNSTPVQRIYDYQMKQFKKNMKIVLAMGGVAVAATGAFIGMANKAGKDIGRGGGHIYDPYTGNKY